MRGPTSNQNNRPSSGPRFSKRDLLKGSAALTFGTVFASPLRAAAPPAEVITPQLIDAAKKEAKVVWYTSIDLAVAEKIAASFKIAARLRPSRAVRTCARPRSFAGTVGRPESDFVRRKTSSQSGTGFAAVGIRGP